jgi:hypothetical protein
MKKLLFPIASFLVGLLCSTVIVSHQSTPTSTKVTDGVSTTVAYARGIVFLSDREAFAKTTRMIRNEGWPLQYSLRKNDARGEGTVHRPVASNQQTK